MGTAKAAESMGTCFCLSTYANFTAAEIGKTTPNLIKWFQLYVYKDPSVTQWLIEKAQMAGFTALVITVDLPVLGNRRRSRKNDLILPSYARNVNLEEIPSFKSHKESPSKADGIHDSFTWEGLKEIINKTTLPVVVKGILTGDDAVKAIQVGCSAVYVSNHGGRQLDGVCSSIMALPEVVEAVSGRAEVYMDGGVRTGTDVLKALALGARAVFVGRPALYSLAVEGEQGVKKMLGMLKDELKLAMQLSGVTNVHHLPKNLISVDFAPKL